MKFEDISENNFFVIDSDNLKNLKTRLFGYIISDNEVITNENWGKKVKIDGTGAYVFIFKSKNQINIFQDLNGSFGLYFYENDGYFAISNSFLKLLGHVKEKYELSLNQDYLKLLITVPIYSTLYDETPINEIKILPRNFKVEIDINTKKVNFTKIDYKENSVNLNSKEGILILDTWYEKWIKIIRNLLIQSNNLSYDLTGGLDSRTVLTLLLTSNIDLRSIQINSLPGIKEDYEIAEKISKHFNFELNKKLNINFQYIDDIETLLDISFYPKLGFTKGIHPENKIYDEPLYTVTGFGGESIRDYPYTSSEDSIRYRANSGMKYSYEFGEQLKKITKDNFDKLSKDYGITNSNDLMTRLYKETMSPYHFGRGVVERFLINEILLTPLLDPLLYKLKFTDENCNDPYLIMTTIYDRYCPDLLNFKIQGGRNIENSTINYAKQINRNYPLNKEKFKLKKIYPNKFSKKVETSEGGFNQNDVKSFLENIFSAPSFKNSFKKYFSESIYNRSLYDFEKDLWSLVNVYGVISIVKIIEDVEFSKNNSNSTFGRWLSNFFESQMYYDNNSYISIGNLSFKLPPKFWINGTNSITNGKDYINFDYIDDINPNIEQYVKWYMDYVRKQNNTPKQEIFNVGRIIVYKVSTNESNTVRFWFVRNNRLYQIYTYTLNELTELNIKFLINTVVDINEIKIGDYIFSLPPNFLIKTNNSITNNNVIIQFKIESDNGYATVKNYVRGYMEYVKNQDKKPIHTLFNVGDINVHKVITINSKTVRYWFVKNNILYQIYTYNSDYDLDYYVKYLINFLKPIEI